MKKIKLYKINYGRTPSNNERRRRKLGMVRHCGKRHTEKWRPKNLPM